MPSFFCCLHLSQGFRHNNLCFSKFYNNLLRTKSFPTHNPPPYQIVFKSLTFGLLCGGRVKSGINSRVWSNKFFRPHTKRSRHRTSATTRPRSIQKKNKQFQTRDQHKNTHKGTRTKMSKEYKDINSGKFKSIGQKEVEQMNGTREMSNEERKQSRRKKKRVGGDAMRHR